jgi:hypothetical protein
MSRHDVGLWLVAVLLAPALVTVVLWSSGPAQAVGAGLGLVFLDAFALVVGKMIKDSQSEEKS